MLEHDVVGLRQQCWLALARRVLVEHDVQELRRQVGRLVERHVVETAQWQLVRVLAGRRARQVVVACQWLARLARLVGVVLERLHHLEVALLHIQDVVLAIEVVIHRVLLLLLLLLLLI